MTSKEVICQICKDNTKEEIIHTGCCTDATYHQSCLNAYLQGGKIKCPVCQQEWNVELNSEIKKISPNCLSQECIKSGWNCFSQAIYKLVWNIYFVFILLFITQFVLNILILANYYQKYNADKIFLVMFITMNIYKLFILMCSCCINKPNIFTAKKKFYQQLFCYSNLLLTGISSIFLIWKYLDDQINFSHYKLMYGGYYFGLIIYLGYCQIKYVSNTKKTWLDNNNIFLSGFLLLFLCVSLNILFGYQIYTIANDTSNSKFWQYLTYPIFGLSSLYWFIEVISGLCFPGDANEFKKYDKDSCMAAHPYPITYNFWCAKYKWLYLFRKNMEEKNYWIKMPCYSEMEITPEDIRRDTCIGFYLVIQYFWFWSIVSIYLPVTLLTHWIPGEYLLSYYNGMCILQVIIKHGIACKNYYARYQNVSNYQVKGLKNPYITTSLSNGQPKYGTASAV